MEPSSLNFDYDILPTTEELKSTQYRSVAQKPYELPESSLELDLVSELTHLTESVKASQISIEQAVADFDALLGLLRPNNIRSFENEFCANSLELKNATFSFITTVAGLIAKKPFLESDEVHQSENGGILAAARFLATYIYVVDSENQTIFLPLKQDDDDIFFAFQRSGDSWSERLPKCHDETAQCVGEKIFSALQGQLKRLSDDAKVTSFGDTARDVQYGAIFAVDRSSAGLKSPDQNPSSFTLDPITVNEQVADPQALWTGLAQRFGGRAFVSWKIDDVSSSDLPALQLHNANSWNPTFTSSLVYADVTYPVTLTVDDVYGNAQVFHTQVIVQNNINERPEPKTAEINGQKIDLTSKKKIQIAAGERVTAKLTEIVDPNSQDKEHRIRWEVYLGNKAIAQGDGDSVSFTAPSLPSATTVRVKVFVDDNHDNNNIGYKEFPVSVSAEVPQISPQTTSVLEKASLAKVFGNKPIQSVAPDQVATKLPDSVLDAVTLDTKVQYYDLDFLVDSSGSMDEKLTHIKPRINDLIAKLKGQMITDGQIRIHFYTYGNQETHLVGQTAWIDASALNKTDFATKLDQVIAFIQTHNMDLETAWYTVWDLHEGPNKQNWQKPSGASGDYEHRMVILSDEEVDSPENVAKIPSITKPFDKTAAEAFVARHQDTSLRIIEISGNEEYERWRVEQLRQGNYDVVQYNQADDAKCPSGMSYIPGRRFPRGGDCSDTAKPWSIVTLDAYCIDKTEVTNAQYAAASGKKSPSREGYNGPKQPVAGINWTDSKAYCESQGKLLPTEAQWENVAKGPDGSFEYPTAGGADPNDTNANWGHDTVETEGTTDVAIYPEGPFGTYDMGGNVLEWTSDNYAGAYDVTQTNNPTGATDEGPKVLRGGSGADHGLLLCSSRRAYLYPNYKSFKVGFRCVSPPLRSQEAE